jgi:hypothetical protein
MTPAWRRRLAAAALGVLILVAAAVAVLALKQGAPALPPRSPAERPKLLLLTSLPIVFPERLSLHGGGSAVLAALRSRYTVEPISVADRAALEGHSLLLMAQPRAQPAEVLVQLDRWVRGGGRVLILADPALEWPSDHPLGSLLRPDFAFADTGLLAHWGLRLDAPDTLGPASIDADGEKVRTASPGALVATADNCSLGPQAIAHCRIGRGEATVIADADFVDAADPASPNLRLLLRELDRLER